MRTFLVILVVAIVSALLSGCGSTVCEVQDRNGVVYVPNQEEPFTGKRLCHYENGQKELEGYYKDGKKDGKWIYWYENGQVKSEDYYKDGRLDWLTP